MSLQHRLRDDLEAISLVESRFEYICKVARYLNDFHIDEIKPLLDQIDIAHSLSKLLNDQLPLYEGELVTSINSAIKLVGQITTDLEQRNFAAVIELCYSENYEVLGYLSPYIGLGWDELLDVLRKLPTTEFEEAISGLHREIWEFFLYGSESEIASVTRAPNVGFLKKYACSKGTYHELCDMYTNNSEVLSEERLRILRLHPVFIGCWDMDENCSPSNVREFLEGAGIPYDTAASLGEWIDLTKVLRGRAREHVKQWHTAFDILRKLGWRYAKSPGPDTDIVRTIQILIRHCLQKGDIPLPAGDFLDTAEDMVNFFERDYAKEWQKWQKSRGG